MKPIRGLLERLGLVLGEQQDIERYSDADAAVADALEATTTARRQRLNADYEAAEQRRRMRERA